MLEGVRLWLQKFCEEKIKKTLPDVKTIVYLHPLRARSSVGSEHLVYTQGVRGSNPFAPTLFHPKGIKLF